MVYLRLGWLNLEQEKWAEALKYFEESIVNEHCGRKTSMAWLGSGIANYRLGNFKSSYESLCQANAMDKESALAWVYLAMADIKCNPGIAAAQTLRQVLGRTFFIQSNFIQTIQLNSKN